MNKEEFNCACTYQGCDNHGNCRACVKYHRETDSLPACYFDKETEKTYDRSVDNFIRRRKK